MQGRSGAVSVIAVAERGALYDPGPCMCAPTAVSYAGDLIHVDSFDMPMTNPRGSI